MVEKEVYLSRISIRVSRFAGYMYTSKLAKTIILRSLEDLADYFKPSKGSEPKLVHVSPLYTIGKDDKSRCIYTYVDCKPPRGIIKCQGPLKPVLLDGTYYFYFGFHTRVLKPEKLLNKLLENDNNCLEFMSQRVCIELESVEIFDAYSQGAEIARDVLNKEFLKVVLSSPALLRDPLRPHGKYKSFLPTPYTIFATPVYTILYTKGIYSVKKLRTELLRLHRLFNETYSAISGLKIKWIHYGKKPEPALIGFINLRLNKEYLEFLNQKLNIVEWLGEIFAHTIALGIGAGRATGFGHVELKTHAKTESEETS